MQALQLVEPRRFELAVMPDPPDPGPGEVVVRLRACGICGSDMHHYLEQGCAGTPSRYPLVLGHEPAGEVVAVGPGVAAPKVGERVAVEPTITCGKCEFCRAGRRNLCENVEFMGGKPLPGLLREYALMPAENALPIPPDMSWEAAAVIEPLAVLLHARGLANLTFGESVAVLGAGPIGLLALQVAKLAGASKVVVADQIPHRLAAARRLGADQVVDVSKESVADAVHDVTGKGAHVVFDCAGKAASIHAAIHAVRPGGRIVLIGITSDELTPVPLWEALHREITLRVQKRNNGNDHEALDLMKAGKVDPASILTHQFPLTDGGKGFEVMGDYADGVIKPLITI